MEFPKIELASSSSPADATVLGFFQGEGDSKASLVANDKSEKKDKSPSASGPLYVGKKAKELEPLMDKLKKSRHFFGKKNETSLLRYYPFAAQENVMLLGLGAPRRFTSEIARQAGAATLLGQRRERLSSIELVGDSVFGKVSDKSLPDYLQAFCEGYWLAGYEYKELKKEEKEPFEIKGLRISGMKSAALERSVKTAEVLAKAVSFARFLGDRPGNFLTPTEFAKQASTMAKEVGLKCTVWGQQEIEKQKMGLFLGVAKGSEEEPKFIILEHSGSKKKANPIVLVGKGITFDSGGISLKPALRMEDMKYDMMGAAAVAGIMRAVSELKLPLNVVGIIATCENMPDGKAQKPGDVARSRSGKTVEIINTDAEGRLILADALDYAQSLEPEAIIDFATLTGAVVDALGTVVSGIMGTHSELLSRIKSSAEVTGERVWELPLFEEYEEDLKSIVADIKNSGIREAGSSKGGTFLKFFMDPKYPWVHCDIAGSAYHRKDVNYHPAKYGAGVMVRLITHLLDNWKALK